MNPLTQFAQNDIFRTGQTIKIPFVINEFDKLFSSSLFSGWIYSYFFAGYLHSINMKVEKCLGHYWGKKGVFGAVLGQKRTYKIR
ncbi:hypothetical protein CDQ28_15695 [Salmonella enterica]|nr:hypothetical protein [Salmonella enterica]EDU0271589.1 hypothetical protein [Salmonella enterica subsp. enterica serovar Glostrup]EBR5509991.1 hypothetical protein [Salmonella enterica]EBS7467037.1 hypothetical protein [Salmonella enterica]ECC6792234.1 hypothetical protein [Salmonella enterica]